MVAYVPFPVYGYSGVGSNAVNPLPFRHLPPKNRRFRICPFLNLAFNSLATRTNDAVTFAILLIYH